MWIEAEQIRVLGPGDVVNLTVWKTPSEQPDEGRGQDDIADGTKPDD